MTAQATVPPVPPDARASLAPTGKLRAGINLGNVILAQKDPATGEWRGVAIDLTRELARRLDVPVEIVPFQSVGAMVDAAKTGAWDIAFMGSDPAREGEITFTSAYVELDATYLVPAGSRLQAVGEVDKDFVVDCPHLKPLQNLRLAVGDDMDGRPCRSRLKGHLGDQIVEMHLLGVEILVDRAAGPGLQGTRKHQHRNSANGPHICTPVNEGS